MSIYSNWFDKNIKLAEEPCTSTSPPCNCIAFFLSKTSQDGSQRYKYNKSCSGECEITYDVYKHKKPSLIFISFIYTKILEYAYTQ